MSTIECIGVKRVILFDKRVRYVNERLRTTGFCSIQPNDVTEVTQQTQDDKDIKKVAICFCN